MKTRLGEGGRAHDQRRHRVARRAVRRAVARGRVEPRERRRDPRPRESGAPEGRVDVRPGAHRRRAQHVRDERLPVRGLGRREVRDHRRRRTSTSRSTSASTGIRTRACTISGCTTASPTRRRAASGTVVVDVGNGKYGGTIEKPKLITAFPINSGHEIYPVLPEVDRQGLPLHRRRGDEPRGAACGKGTNYSSRRRMAARRRAASRRRRAATRTSSTSPIR